MTHQQHQGTANGVWFMVLAMIALLLTLAVDPIALLVYATIAVLWLARILRILRKECDGCSEVKTAQPL